MRSVQWIWLLLHMLLEAQFEDRPKGGGGGSTDPEDPHTPKKKSTKIMALLIRNLLGRLLLVFAALDHPHFVNTRNPTNS